MLRIKRKFSKLAVTTAVVVGLLLTGHLLAVRFSANYNSQIGQVSSVLAEYINNQFSTTVELLNGKTREIKFSGAPPTPELSKSDIVAWNLELYDSYINAPVSEPKVDNLVRAPEDPRRYERANATLVVLVRNKEFDLVRRTVLQIEAKFNNKFRYPYVFINDGKFSRSFVKQMNEILPYREVYFEQIDPEVWNRPLDIDRLKERQGIDYLRKEKIGYANMLSYHNMCRFYSGNFYNLPRLQQFKWYWRFEPSTNYFCDIDYDVFKFMEDNNKTYGFTLSLYDAHQSVKSLWTTTMEFVQKNPQYLHPNAAIDFLTENMMNPEKPALTQGYSTCHFWSNFEIGNMDFFRSPLYNEWFKYLDLTGGFYYERWGDLPVHSIGLLLFEDKAKIHWFRDIGYEHHPYVLCPNSDKCSTRKKGERKDKTKVQCEVGRFTYPNMLDQNCLPNWIRYEMDEQARAMY